MEESNVVATEATVNDSTPIIIDSSASSSSSNNADNPLLVSGDNSDNHNGTSTNDVGVTVVESHVDTPTTYDDDDTTEVPLFGPDDDYDINNNPLLATTIINGGVPLNLDMPPPPTLNPPQPPQPTMKMGGTISKLSASGLLSNSDNNNNTNNNNTNYDNDGEGIGLFDDIDDDGGGGLFDNIDDNFDDNFTDNFGSMGLGVIPLSSHQAPPPPPSAPPSTTMMFASYRPPSPEVKIVPQQQQQQQQQQPQYPPQHHPPQYPPQHQRPPQTQQQGVMNAMAGSYYYSTTGAGQMTQHPGMMGGAGLAVASGVAQQQQWNNNYTNSLPNQHYHQQLQQQQQQQPSGMAGMHVGNDVNFGGGVPTRTIHHPPQQQPPLSYNNQYHYGAAAGMNIPPPPPPQSITNYIAPPPFEPQYGRVSVTDPMLIQGTGLFAGPPHWTYLVTVYSKNSAITRLQQQQQSQPNDAQLQQQQQQQQEQPVSAVRRRFRHFVALEDRLRQSVPGAILPPRPEKHPNRAIEEATASQSSDFAQARSRELSVYMNALVNHPHAGSSPELKLFLLLQDHIGTAWPEVSSSAFTRMTTVVTNTAETLTDKVDGVLAELGTTAQQVAAGEDSAEILALSAYEGRRMGAVSSSVPKVEGTVSLIRERGDRLGSTGLEMSKLAKDVGWCDQDLAAPMEVLAGALLRCGRRTKRLGLELGAAITPFVIQYRTCKYEQMAFADRRACLKRRTEARTKADGRAAKLMMNQTMMQSVGRLGSLERMETEAAMYDEFAMEATREADEVAIRLQQEVGRISAIRVKEWDASLKIIASGMKESCAENASIWESALETFKREFPDCPEIVS
jgi:hypothetical protein